MNVIFYIIDIRKSLEENAFIFGLRMVFTKLTNLIENVYLYTNEK